MKTTTKLLNLLTAFLAVIGICAASLVLFVVIYTQITGGFSPKRTADHSAKVVQADNSSLPEDFLFNTEPNNTPESSNISDADLPDYFNEETEPLSITSQSLDTNDEIPVEYSSALSKAINYSSMMYMSKAGIYDQLTSPYGEGFSAEAAQYAVDNMEADWNSNALQKAKDYSDTMHMSKASIYDQLVSDYGEKFAPSEAQYAVDNLNADYNANALQKAKEYQNFMNMSPDAIHEQLTSQYGEKFTQSEADYAVSNINSINTASSGFYSAPARQGTSSTGFITESSAQPVHAYSSNEGNPGAYTSTSQAPATDTVYLSETGSKYHSIDHCGKMDPDKARLVSLEYAASMGFEKCEKCF